MTDVMQCLLLLISCHGYYTMSSLILLTNASLSTAVIHMSMTAAIFRLISCSLSALSPHVLSVCSNQVITCTRRVTLKTD